MKGPVLIASDGTAGSAGAVAVGVAIARNRNAGAHVLSVMPPPPPMVYGDMGAPPEGYTMLQAAAMEDRRQSLQSQIEELVPGAATAQVESGAPAWAIVEEAKRLGAELIVAGTGPRTTAERWLRSDTALRIIQLSTVPVLLVPRDARRAPSSALVAIDFSDFSVNAAREAMNLLAPPGRMTLVHVIWPPFEAEALPSTSDFWRTYEVGARARLDRLAEELRQGWTGKIETALLTGDAKHEIVSLATRLNVDLVAGGSHGRGFLGRLLLGSTSSGLIHGSRGQVLIVPPPDAPDQQNGLEKHSLAI